MSDAAGYGSVVAQAASSEELRGFRRGVPSLAPGLRAPLADPGGILPLLTLDRDARERRRALAGLSRVLSGQAAGDDPCGPVVAHRYPVEDVGGVHRAFLVGDDHELGAVGEPPDELQEAVDVGVVKRRLDLVEDVEGAGPGEEDSEDEGERDERLLAAREKRELPRRLPGRGDLDLDSELLTFLVLLDLRVGPLADLQRGRIRDRPQLDPTQRAAPTREEVLDHLLEVVRGGLEGLLEGPFDLAVDVADQRLQLAHPALGVLALCLQRLDVLTSLLVLALGERVDRADLGAAPVEPLEAAPDVGSLLLAEILLRRRNLFAEPLGDRRQRLGRLGPPVAEVGRLDLRGGEAVGGRLQLRLDLVLALRAGAHLLGDLVSVVLAADDLSLGALDPRADRGLDPRGRGRGRLDVGKELLAPGEPPPEHLAVPLS